MYICLQSSNDGATICRAFCAALQRYFLSVFEFTHTVKSKEVHVCLVTAMVLVIVSERGSVLRDVLRNVVHRQYVASFMRATLVRLD
jgi:hypothetical protein